MSCQNADHQNQYTRGHTWRCRTCNMGFGNNRCICDACAEKCHKGHDLVEGRLSPSYFCDCAAFLGTCSCKCCNQKQVCSKIVYPEKGGSIQQRKWRCLTCNATICTSCKERCHREHEVVDEGVETFKCQCDDGGKCIAKEPVKELVLTMNSFEVADCPPSIVVGMSDDSFSLETCKISQLRSAINSSSAYNDQNVEIIINQRYTIELPLLVAASVSSKITRILESDPTIKEFAFKFEASDSSLHKIDRILTRGLSVRIAGDDDIIAFYNFGLAIGNEQFMEPFKNRKKSLDAPINIDNAVFDIKSKLSLGITDLTREITYIASNFDEFAKRKEFVSFSMRERNYDIVESILNHQSFHVVSEDTLLEYLLAISKESSNKESYARLFKYVFLEYCSSDNSKELLEFINGFISSSALQVLIDCLGRRVVQPSIPMRSNSNNIHYRPRPSSSNDSKKTNIKKKKEKIEINLFP